MSKILLICLLFCVNIFISLGDEDFNEDEIYKTSDTYTAAVIEFNPPGSKFSNAEQKVEAKFQEYIKLINEAKEHEVDILIFPEATLNYNGLTGDELKKFAIPLPSEISNLEYENSCDDYSYNAILNDLSEAVSNASIYVLVNLVEIEESKENLSDAENSLSLYNTNIVFNRQGCIVSKYRKINLFIEPSMSVPEEPELASFETDFGVTFGHFICFDIIFKSPAYDLVLSNISHILYPSMWYSEVPFLTSIQIQQNFAYRNNIVLLSAGANSPSESKTGSGIFIGKYGAAEAFISYRDETKMIIAKIPKNIDDVSFTPSEPSIKPYTAIEMDKLKTWSFTPKNIHPLSENFHYNDGNIECEFTVNYSKLITNDDGENIGYIYKFAVFNGIRNCANIINVGEMYCAIIPCLSNDQHTCGQRFKNSEKLVPSIEFHSIKINMKIHASDKDDYLIMPTSLDFSLHSLSVQGFEFSHAVADDEFESYEIETTNELREILTFGVYGRNYSADYKNSSEIEMTVVTTTTEFEELEETKVDRDSKMKKSLEDDDEYVVFKLAIYSGLMVVLCIIAAILVYRRLQHPYEHPLIIMRRKSEMNAS